MNEIVELRAWNTGCHYTSAGQRIAVARYQDGTIVFMDIDRCLGGVLDKKFPWPINQEQVMAAYKGDRYEDIWPGHEMWFRLSVIARDVAPLDLKF